MPLPARIPRTVPHQRKEPRPGMSPKHLADVSKCICVVCGKDPGGVAHHLLGSLDGLPKGMGRRNADRWSIPLCHENRDAQYPDSAHNAGNDEAWLAGKGIDGRALAAALWANRGDLEAMQRVAFRAWQKSMAVRHG